MYSLLRKILFLFSAEKAHHLVVFSLKLVFKTPLLNRWVKGHYSIENPLLERELFGLKFSNPIGLAAGFDKDAYCFEEMGSLGFGFIEIGTVTPKPQDGNDKPRLFRLKKDEAIVNRMGFNNKGALNAVERLKSRTDFKVIIGGNIGKNKWTPNESATEDYLYCFAELFPYVDYFAINVSSPNTANLRELQEKEPLTKLILALQALNHGYENPKPILLKIAPDLSNSQLDDIIAMSIETKLDGIIATNTTLSRSGLKTDPSVVAEIGAGGLSGKPVSERSTEVIRYIHSKTQGKLPIIGVGGIHSAKDAMEKLEAGASLVQLYTGFVYEGPNLIKNIKKALINHAK
jgi:dihydroorotate dehydrogenase